MTFAKSLLAILAIASLAACSPVRTIKNVVDAPVSWKFIQSVGGIAVGKPRLDGGNVWVPLKMDLSGSKAITLQPTLSDSGRKCIRATLVQEDRMFTAPGYYDLFLQVYDGPLDEEEKGGCDEVPIFSGDLTPPLASAKMTFRIWYHDYVFSKHLVGEVTL